MEPLTYPNLQLEMSDIGILVVEEMTNRLFDNNSVVTGQLAKSLKPVTTSAKGDIITQGISLLQYGIYVDNGAERKRGGMPPVKDYYKLDKTKTYQCSSSNVTNTICLGCC
jgi:hypothetical protein